MKKGASKSQTLKHFSVGDFEAVLRVILPLENRIYTYQTSSEWSIKQYYFLISFLQSATTPFLRGDWVEPLRKFGSNLGVYLSDHDSKEFHNLIILHSSIIMMMKVNVFRQDVNMQTMLWNNSQSINMYVERPGIAFTSIHSWQCFIYHYFHTVSK